MFSSPDQAWLILDVGHSGIQANDSHSLGGLVYLPLAQSNFEPFGGTTVLPSMRVGLSFVISMRGGQAERPFGISGPVHCEQVKNPCKLLEGGFRLAAGFLCPTKLQMHRYMGPRIAPGP